jgi:hypothetical protein
MNSVGMRAGAETKSGRDTCHPERSEAKSRDPDESLDPRRGPSTSLGMTSFLVCAGKPSLRGWRNTPSTRRDYDSSFSSKWCEVMSMPRFR